MRIALTTSEIPGLSLPEKIALAKEEIGNMWPFLGRMMLLAAEIFMLPDAESVVSEDRPEPTFYALHNMAPKVLGPQVERGINYQPMPGNVPALADAIRWSSCESLRLEGERVEQVKAERDEVAV